MDEEEKVERDEVKVANRDIRIYLGECLYLFQKFDSITLSAVEKHRESLRYIADIFKAFGVKIEDKYLGKRGQIVYKSEDIDIINRRTGRRDMRTIYRIRIIKHPDYYMFTDPDTAVELERRKDL